MLAETIKSQLIDPLHESIKGQTSTRQNLQADFDLLRKEEQEAKRSLEKARAQVAAADRQVEACLAAKQRIQVQATANHNHHPVTIKLQRAEEQADMARSALRQAEEWYKTIATRHAGHEYPRLLMALRKSHTQRTVDAFKTIHLMVEAEAEADRLVNESCANMARTLKSVNMDDDMAVYDRLFSGNGTIEPASESPNSNTPEPPMQTINGNTSAKGKRQQQ